jgi:hypothetical protein
LAGGGQTGRVDSKTKQLGGFRMKKLLTGGLVFFAGVVSMPLPVSPFHVPRHTPPEYRQDPRAETLKGFFAQCECPAVQYTGAFLEAADHYDLDWRLLPSLSFVESTGGKLARNNNMFGWDSGRAQFPTPTASIYAVADRLANSDLYRDKNLDEILATYNPDADYAGKVKSVMRRIAPVQ